MHSDNSSSLIMTTTVQSQNTKDMNLGDLDGDGKPDMITSNTAGDVKLWSNSGDGHFSELSKDI
jgi:hypothetical protein